MLSEYQERLLEENETLILFATVGTFNQKDKEAGNRQIYQCKLDEQKRPLFIVYDEGHNLSDQQTDLLLELKPSVFLIAKNKDFITRIDTGKVVEAGLVKKVLKLAAYETPMEETISSLVEDLKQIEEQIEITNLPMEKCGIKPENIAVYCDLKFAKNYPKPPEFKLFSGGGEKKYQDFTAVYAAYIDRFINSKIAVKQIIGRVLRQPKPDITHQLPEILNTAHFYIQIEKQSAFKEVIEEVNQELQQTAPEIEVKIVSSTEKPELVKVQELTKGTGYRSITKKYIDEQGNTQQVLREKIGETNRTTARAIFYREIIRKLPQARGIFCLDDPKFDALVVDIYLENTCLEQSSVEVYQAPDILLYNPKNSLSFKNSLHERYSQLNKLEKEFAQELDKFPVKWCRNPSRSGYAIPLITRGDTKNFYPDFLVWYENNIIAIDTSGEHLIKDKTDRKLLNIPSSENNSPRILVRFVSKGKWSKEVAKIDENVDEKGHKMSKSLGNVIDPEDIMKQFVVSSDFTKEVKVSIPILENTRESYQKIRNTLRFLLGNLANMPPELKSEKDLEPKLSLVDYYILHKLEKLVLESQKNYNEYNFNPTHSSLLNFCINDLSSFYFEISKDSLYCDSLYSLRRRQIITTLYYLLRGLLKIISPILPYLSEEVYQNIPFRFGFAGQESVYLANYSPNLLLSPDNKKEIELITDFLLPLRQDVYQTLEKARQGKIINTNSQAHLTIHLKGKSKQDYPKFNLEELLLVAKVDMSKKRENSQ
ncbi:16960_t:CDS:2 [Gigaspora margarita]|uniref:16960_t:CDS:1 n=1 Tax=Gigaspora margarita TaxID=4874 RepID=A0ABM8VW40_GIGMA|nr:16960_t:CDS:2 [Gigaspora margarita]